MALPFSHWKIPALIIILLVAAGLRFWHLGSLPQGFHNDEVMNGYVGRYILENGTDLYGNSWPVLYFNNFGDYPNVIPMYLSGAFTYVFGATPLAVRFPIALMGTLSVVLVYCVGRWLWKPHWVALVPAVLLSVLPWHITLSRATAEGITASAVFLLGLFVVFRGIDRRSVITASGGFLLLTLTYLLYPSFRIVTPLTILALPLLGNTKHWKYGLTAVAVGFFILTFLISQTVWGKGRYEQTSLLTHNNVLGGRSINYSIGLGPNRVLEARAFHNIPVLAAREFLHQYASYFSPDFLFSKGGKPARYTVPEHGLLYWSFAVGAVLVLTTLVVSPVKTTDWKKLFQNRRKKYSLFFIWVLLLSPLPAAMTLDDVPNVHRSVAMSLVLCLLAGIMAYMISLPQKWGKYLVGALGVFLIAESIFFWHYYANLHSVVTTPYRKDEQQVLADWLINHHNEYDRIYLPGSELISLHYLFNSGRFPSQLAGQFHEGIQLNNLDNLIFISQNCVTASPEIATQSGKVAVINRSECDPRPEYLPVEMLKRFDWTDAYTILVPKQ